MTITKVSITETTLNLHLSDHSVRGWPLVNHNACFLFKATKAQRDNWDIQDKGRTVVWPDLSRSITVEQLG